MYQLSIVRVDFPECYETVENIYTSTCTIVFLIVNLFKLFDEDP